MRNCKTETGFSVDVGLGEVADYGWIVVLAALVWVLLLLDEGDGDGGGALAEFEFGDYKDGWPDGGSS